MSKNNRPAKENKAFIFFYCFIPLLSRPVHVYSSCLFPSPLLFPCPFSRKNERVDNYQPTGRQSSADYPTIINQSTDDCRPVASPLFFLCIFVLFIPVSPWKIRDRCGMQQTMRRSYGDKRQRKRCPDNRPVVFQSRKREKDR